MDDAINLSGNADSQQLTLVLDDTDGTIKTILDAHDVHKRDAQGVPVFHGLCL